MLLIIHIFRLPITGLIFEEILEGIFRKIKIPIKSAVSKSTKAGRDLRVGIFS